LGHILFYKGRKEGKETDVVHKLIPANIGNHYDSDGWGSLLATAQSSSYLKILGVQDRKSTLESTFIFLSFGSMIVISRLTHALFSPLRICVHNNTPFGEIERKKKKGKAIPVTGLGCS
jgi:hypothetical protein